MLIVSGTISLDPASARFWQLAGTLVEKTLEAGASPTASGPTCPTGLGAPTSGSRPIAEHFGTPHMQEFMAGMGEVGVTGIDLHQHVVEESTKLM